MYTKRAVFALAGAAMAAAVTPAWSQTPKAPFDRERYQKYVDLYEVYDPAFLDFYAEDAVLGSAPLQIHGRQAIYDLLKLRRYNMKETMDIIFFAADASAMAVQVNGGFFCTGDIDDGKLWGRPLKKGEVRRVRTVLLYTFNEAGKIKTIGGPPAEILEDWHFEKT